MIHSLAKQYKLTLKQAAMYKESDFWLMRGFDNLEALREKYINDEKQN